jgi:hypothetical protein
LPVAFVTTLESDQDDANAALFALLGHKQHTHRIEVIHLRFCKRAEMATATQRAEDVDQNAGLGEVSLGQKMMSAVSGSILTSLLGVYYNCVFTTSPSLYVYCIRPMSAPVCIVLSSRNTAELNMKY